MSWFYPCERRTTRRCALRAATGAALAATTALIVIARTSTATARPVQDELTLAQAVPAAASGDPLGQMSLEDLMNVEVTSVSKSKQRISEAPAAIYVITREDIERSGLNSIPELLRLAPGLDVARANASAWAIGSRGFNHRYQRELLVLFDGRTVYLPTSSGVYWDAQDYLLPDLDRIEVIRGPGATLWGANAVNGVINITSKSTRDTQGWLLSGTGGNVDQDGGVRYGGKVGEDTYFRLYTKYRHTSNFETADGADADDAWQSLLGGFRIDHYGTDKDVLTLQGQGFGATERDTLSFPQFTPPFAADETHGIDVANGYALGRWTHTISDKSDFSVQVYYDYFRRFDGQNHYDAHTWDVDAQHRFPIGDRQELIWGGGLRVQRDASRPTGDVLVFDPHFETFTTANAFVQDDVTLVPERLHLILGTKVEYNTRTHFEYEPSIRGLWTPDDRNTVWAAASRAVRTPSAFDDHATLVTARFPTGPGSVGESRLIGNSDLDSEKLYAYELGYRVRPTRSLSFDLATFYNDYDDLIGSEAGAPSFQPAPAPARLVVPATAANNVTGESYGFELAANWNVTPDWRLSGSYTWLQLDLHNGGPFDEEYLESSSPRNQVQLHSYYDVTKHLALNASAYYVETISDGAGASVPSYVRLDLGMTWRPRDGMELSAGIQNVLDDRHPEFVSGNGAPNQTETPRALYAQLNWRF